MHDGTQANPAPEQAPEQAGAERGAWTAPSVVKIDAGSAEGGDINNTDGTFTS
ncbi:MAG TPA: hypothetical protein VF552_04590 [Allosphingosinicella sp.]|jgi:hypothetical protein